MKKRNKKYNTVKQRIYLKKEVNNNNNKIISFHQVF